MISSLMLAALVFFSTADSNPSSLSVLGTTVTTPLAVDSAADLNDRQTSPLPHTNPSVLSDNESKWRGRVGGLIGTGAREGGLAIAEADTDANTPSPSAVPHSPQPTAVSTATPTISPTTATLLSVPTLAPSKGAVKKEEARRGGSMHSSRSRMGAKGERGQLLALAGVVVLLVLLCSVATCCTARAQLSKARSEPEGEGAARSGGCCLRGSDEEAPLEQSQDDDTEEGAEDECYNSYNAHGANDRRGSSLSVTENAEEAMLQVEVEMDSGACSLKEVLDEERLRVSKQQMKKKSEARLLQQQWQWQQQQWQQWQSPRQPRPKRHGATGRVPTLPATENHTCQYPEVSIKKRGLVLSDLM